MTLIIMEKQVCLFLEGCGLINYIFYRCVLTRLTHSTYLLSSVIEDLLLYLTLLFNFLYSSLLPVINEPKIHLFPVIYYKSEINTLDIEYKSSLLRGNG
jgi:hypothetical protein